MKRMCCVNFHTVLHLASSNDGKATVSSGGAHKMRESFKDHSNALAFGKHNKNATAGKTPGAETGTKAVRRTQQEQ